MKLIKVFTLLFAIIFCYSSTQAQDFQKNLGVKCDCIPGEGSCNTSCTFSECCICYTKGQNAACGCYWGVAVCKTGKVGTLNGFTDPKKVFDDLDPKATVNFNFKNFKNLISFFSNMKINNDKFQEVLQATQSKYNYSSGYINISNDDFELLLKEYLNLINQLDIEQQNDLNLFIKTI